MLLGPEAQHAEDLHGRPGKAAPRLAELYIYIYIYIYIYS